MRLSVLTMITKPDERQDMWREAIANYCKFADEVIVVCGDEKTINDNIDKFEDKVKFIFLEWVEDWTYEQLPKHLNKGLEYCTGDWVLKLDIDQLIHEDHHTGFEVVIKEAEEKGFNGLALEKIHHIADNKHRLKGKQLILFKRTHNMRFGLALDQQEPDLCQPVEQVDFRQFNGYDIPVGKLPKHLDTNLRYWNYSFTFKTQEVAKEHFWRFARAYEGYFKNNRLGQNKEEAWEYFLQTFLESSQPVKMVDPNEHPGEMVDLIRNIKPEQLGHSLWEHQG